VHINGTIYYSLEIQDQSYLFRRMITAEDVTDPDIRSIIEDCGDEYYQWLEEADLEDLPNDLELLVHFNDPYDSEPLGTFMSYQKEVKFQCCPVEYEDSDSESNTVSPSSTSTDASVVVNVFPKQAFWISAESYPMHHTRCYPNLEVAFFAALAYSADAHTSGQSAMGRFNFQECRRLIELFLELKSVSAGPEFAHVANGAVLWHLSRVMHDIDVHFKQRVYASELRAEPLPRPSKILDGLLSCVFFGVHFIYRDRLHRAHPASHASLMDFRAFVRAMLEEWSDANLLATVFVAANVTFITALPGVAKFQRTASLASTLLSLLEIVTGLHHLWRHRIRANGDYDDVHKYFGRKRHGMGWTFSNTTLLASALSVPIASLVWAVLCFMVAASSYCLQSMGTNTGRKVLFGLEIGSFVLAFPATLLFFSDVDTWKERRRSQQ